MFLIGPQQLGFQALDALLRQGERQQIHIVQAQHIFLLHAMFTSISDSQRFPEQRPGMHKTACFFFIIRVSSAFARGIAAFI